MPEEYNNLSTDQLKVLLQAMESKLSSVNTSTPVVEPISSISSPNSQNLTSIDQLAQQFGQLLEQLQTSQSIPQQPKVTITPEPPVIETPVIKPSATPFGYMAANALQSKNTPIQDNTINSKIFEKIDEMLEQMGFATELMSLLKDNKQNLVDAKITQLVTIFKLMPDFEQIDNQELETYLVNVTEEFKVMAEVKKEKVPAAEIVSNSAYIPKINLKPAQQKAQPKIIEIKDIFKKFKKEELPKEKEPEVVAPVINTPIKEESKKTEDTSFLDKLTFNKEKKQPENSQVSMKQFELLKDLLLTYVDGAMQRELVRTSKEVEQNKYFLFDLYDKALIKDNVKIEIEILEKILERLNKKLNMVKTSKGTIAAWVELDEDINNVKNFYIIEWNKVQ